MPAPRRAILADISEQNLNPNVAYSEINHLGKFKVNDAKNVTTVQIEDVKEQHEDHEVVVNNMQNVIDDNVELSVEKIFASTSNQEIQEVENHDNKKVVIQEKKLTGKKSKNKKVKLV